MGTKQTAEFVDMHTKQNTYFTLFVLYMIELCAFILRICFSNSFYTKVIQLITEHVYNQPPLCTFTMSHGCVGYVVSFCLLSNAYFDHWASSFRNQLVVDSSQEYIYCCCFSLFRSLSVILTKSLSYEEEISIELDHPSQPNQKKIIAIVCS